MEVLPLVHAALLVRAASMVHTLPILQIVIKVITAGLEYLLALHVMLVCRL